MPDDLVLRTATEADLDALAPIHSQSFVASVEDAKGWLGRGGLGNVRLAECDGRLVGGLVVLPMGQFFGGRSVAMAGIAGVAIDPAARRRGYATRMMTELLRQVAGEGFPISTLFASTHRLYRSVGYEEAGAAWRAELDPRSLRVTEPTLAVRRLGEADYPEMEALYRRCAVALAGHLDRGPYIWGRHRLVRDNDVGADWGVVDAGGALRGYATIRQRRGARLFDMTVLDVVADGPAAARRIWALLADHATLVRKIDLPLAPNGVLRSVLDEPPSPVRYSEGWLVRMVDVAAALRARGYAPGLAASFVLAVDDPVLPANHGLFAVEAAGGSAHVERLAAGKPDVRVTARGLAALYTGFTPPSEAVAAGWLEGSPSALEQLGALFAGPFPWMPDSF